MNYIILGAGNIGFQLAKYLIQQKKNVVLIEKDKDKAQHASNLLDCLVINEQGNNLDTLEKAGIRGADFFISVTDSDEINMIACGMVTSEFKVPCKIAKIRNIDYSSTRVWNSHFLGIDYLVNPEIELSRDIIGTIEDGAVSDIVHFDKSRLEMRSITTNSSMVIVNKKVNELKAIIGADFLAAVILRGNDFIIPHGNSIIRDGDKLYLIADRDNFKLLFSRIGKKPMTINKIVIIGGNSVTTHIIDHFFKDKKIDSSFLRGILNRFKAIRKRKISIIDSSYENCKLMADQFPEAMIYNTDISDEEFTEEELLSEADLVIAATQNQELNIVNAVYAKSVGAKRAIVLVNKAHYVHIASNLGIDVAFSPVASMVASILKFMRKKDMGNVYSISGGEVEIRELTVEPAGKSADKKIRDLKLPKDTLIIAVTRGADSLVPNGDLVLLSGDNVIVIALKESINKVEGVF